MTFVLLLNSLSKTNVALALEGFIKRLRQHCGLGCRIARRNQSIQPLTLFFREKNINRFCLNVL